MKAARVSFEKSANDAPEDHDYRERSKQKAGQIKINIKLTEEKGEQGESDNSSSWRPQLHLQDKLGPPQLMWGTQGAVHRGHPQGVSIAREQRCQESGKDDGDGDWTERR